jgi:ABC-type polysaccharide/polyol phosphate transport system ATPase subunit
MVSVDFRNVCVDYPIYMLEAQRLRAKLLHSLSFGRYGSNGQVRTVVNALRDVSFSLQSGHRLGIIGMNGAGKTTLLQTAAGILEPARGWCRVEGRISALYNIGLGFDPEASGYENILLRGLFMGLTPREIAEITPDIEAFTELGDFLKLPIRTYSAGMQVRLAFAIATSIKPEVLIMDEWIGAGDERFLQRSKERLQTIVAQSALLLLASHSEALIKSNCDQVILLHHGEVLEYAGVDEVYRSYRKLTAR